MRQATGDNGRRTNKRTRRKARDKETSKLKQILEESDKQLFLNPINKQTFGHYRAASGIFRLVHGRP
jgi:succinate dehydrogenase flavin-adding protein (antitoxin of CptAB toxin-antitoxin module)